MDCNNQQPFKHGSYVHHKKWAGCVLTVAAMRRGCVTIMDDPGHFERMNWGTCVVFPLPVSPVTMMTCKKDEMRTR